MKRRSFLSQAGAIGFGAWLADVTPAHAARAPVYYDPRKLYHVAISSESFRDCFAETRGPGASVFGSPTVLLDFPQMVADRYEVHNLEFLSAHFSSSSEQYLTDLRRQIRRVRSRIIGIQIDEPALQSGGGISSREPGVRAAAVAEVKKWVEVASTLGARSICAEPGQINPADLTPTLESYRQILAYSRPRRITVLIENRLALEPEDILSIIRSVGGPDFGALPDFGGFGSEGARLEGLRELFPRARTLCHAAGFAFNTVGNETAYNFQRCIAIAKQTHFRGVYSVAYRGSGDPYQGTQSVINELIRSL